MKPTPLRRTKPLKRSTKPLRRTRLKRAKRGVSYAQRKQREAVRERSGGRCEFLYLPPKKYSDGIPMWCECLARGVDCAHIYPRRLCGKARDTSFVVLYACRVHHNRYDAHSDDVCVPTHLRRTAYDSIVAITKDRESTLAALGERP